MEQPAETVTKGVGVKAASGGEFGSRFDDAGDDHGNDEIALTGGRWVKDGIEMKIAQGTENGGDMTMRMGAGDAERVRQGSCGGSQQARKGRAKSFNLMGGEVGDVGKGAGFDLAIEAERFTEENGGRGVAVGDCGHVHAYIVKQSY